MRASAPAVQTGFFGSDSAAPIASLTIPVKGHLPPEEGGSSDDSSPPDARFDRRVSMGSSGVVRPPILTPNERTIWVSALLVSIAVCIEQVGHSYTMDIEPSNGPCVDF